MRIQQHLSVILFVAVVGAISLAAAVGVLLGGLETAALEYGSVSAEHRSVEHLVAEARALGEAADRITVMSSEDSFLVVDRAIERSRVYFAGLQPSGIVAADALDAARQALQGAEALAAGRSAGIQDPDDLAKLQIAAAGYAAAIGEIDALVADAVEAQGRRLTGRRRLIMLVIGAICFAYLAIIERVRHWTTRHVVDPIQKLAEAAKLAMKGGATPTALQEGKTEELSTLASMLDSFADTIKANVSARTAQLTRQAEVLEQEVRRRRRSEQALRFSALRDKMTGLCSRDLLLDRVARCVERSKRREGFEYVVLFIDLDQFGNVNDDHGQFIGDQAVIAVAERFRTGLAEVVGETGVECATLARLASDEFAILLDGLENRDIGALVAERLHEMLSRPLRVQDRDMQVSASIGIAFRDEGDTPEGVLANAESAMHYAKAAGRSKFTVFHVDMLEQVADREQRRLRLQRAMERGEFTVVYQPIISLKTGRLAGFEALARWDDPERGPVSPVEFIADAEQTGAIVELGRWVLQQACLQLQRWQDLVAPAGGPMSVSVNVSSHQLADADLLSDVQDALRSTGVPPTSLKIEITESVIMDNPDAVTDVLRQLKLLGCEVHMDDFGTGYSSLSYLHRLPIDVLKIDREFMSSMSNDHDYADIVHTVVALARTLEMGVTVEGVEALEQLEAIQALDCDYAQGYLFSKPVTAEEATTLIGSQRSWLRDAA